MKIRKIFLIILVLLLIGISFFTFTQSKKEEKKAITKTVNIEEVLRTEAYAYLPKEAKDYIREVYNESGQLLLTEKNKTGSQPYLNPEYVEYLTSNKED